MALALSRNSAFYPLLLQPKTYSLNPSAKTMGFKARSSHSNHSIQVTTSNKSNNVTNTKLSKSKRKPRPSFFQQIRHKWSLKLPSTTQKYPWQEEEEEEEDDDEEEDQEQEKEEVEQEEIYGSDSELEASNPSVTENFTPPNRLVIAPWIHGTTTQKPHFVYHQPGKEDNFDGFFKGSELNATLKEEIMEKEVNYNNQVIKQQEEDEVKFDDNSVESKRDKEMENDAAFFNEQGNIEVSDNGDSGSIDLPWKGEEGAESVQGDRRRKRSNTEVAERTIPEHELKRLRNVALRMLERIKVGRAGITQHLVDSIHEKWKLDEVVKLKFEEPLSCNMKRTHEILEVSCCKFLNLLNVV